MSAPFCARCGAPESEARNGACSYCGTPVPRRFDVRALYGHAFLRPVPLADVRLEAQAQERRSHPFWPFRVLTKAQDRAKDKASRKAALQGVGPALF